MPHVFSGVIDQAFESGKQALNESCRLDLEIEEDDLLLVSVPGGQKFFDWKHIGAAAEVAARLMPPGGRVAIVADCEEPTGPAAKMLRRCDEPDDLVKPLSVETPDDGKEILQLIRALGKVRLYLYSPIAEAVVEELGLQPLTTESELHRLIESVNKVHVIPNANYGWASDTLSE